MKIRWARIALLTALLNVMGYATWFVLVIIAFTTENVLLTSGGALLSLLIPAFLGRYILPRGKFYPIIFEWMTIGMISTLIFNAVAWMSLRYPEDLFTATLMALVISMVGILGSCTRREKLPRMLLSSEDATYLHASTTDEGVNHE